MTLFPMEKNKKVFRKKKIVYIYGMWYMGYGIWDTRFLNLAGHIF